jgi:hypothetical protein
MVQFILFQGKTEVPKDIRMYYIGWTGQTWLLPYRHTLDLEYTRRCKLAAMELIRENLTIQDAAEVTGLTVHTLRCYEQNGLIHPIARTGNTRRWSLAWSLVH